MTTLSFLGDFLDGGLEGHTVKIDCTYDSAGDPYEQNNIPCTVQYFGPAQRGAYQTIKSKSGYVKIAGEGRALIVGVHTGLDGQAHVIETTVHLKAASQLVQPLGVTATGVTTANTYGACIHMNDTSTCSEGMSASQECLIYTIDGPGVDTAPIRPTS